MTLFGRTFEAQEIASLAFLLAALVFWLFVYRGERGWARWFKRWEGDRKARREAELATDRKGDGAARRDARRGPWG